MGFLVRAVGKKHDGSSAHFCQVRWRSDDPWGTLSRAMVNALQPFIPPQVDRTKSVHVARVEMDLFFVPDNEDGPVSPAGEAQDAIVGVLTPQQAGVVP